jgi:hypothetical protein
MRSRKLVRAFRSLLLLAGATACDQAAEIVALAEEGAESASAANLKLESAGGSTRQPWGTTLVPSPDGPKLAPTALVVPVREGPSRDSSPVGYLRVGERISRSPEAVTREGCSGGWYALHPVGFVCAGDDVTFKTDHPIVRAIARGPDRTKPLPYPYAFVRSIAPNYLRVPTTDEQVKYEMHLERHLRNYRKLHEEWDRLGPGANDVPLGPDGRAIGPVPDDTRPPGMSERFGGDGTDAIPWWLEGERRIPNISSFKAPPYAVIADRIKRHAGVALIGSFVSGESTGGRRFAITTDARLIPGDKLKADGGSSFHGADIRNIGLPVAFAKAEGTHYWNLGAGGAKRGDRIEPRDLVQLTGSVRRVGGKRMVEAKNGFWVRSDEIQTIAKSTKLPWFATKRTRWIEVALLSQTLVLWEGATPVYATLVSTGRDGLGDPNKTLSTPQGTFRIYQKHVTTTMDSKEADSEFELRDVPWVMYFKGGYAIHGAYWHDDFGRSRSHGCVNLSPIDARIVFDWSMPDVPDHWHAAYASDTFGQGTLVHIHP